MWELWCGMTDAEPTVLVLLNQLLETSDPGYIGYIPKLYA